MTFHSFDPWDVLMELQTEMVKQRQNLITLSHAHNVAQQMINDLVKVTDSQSREITKLRRELEQHKLQKLSNKDA